MILQRDPRLPENIREYGCYYMSLLWHGNRLAQAQLDTDRIANVIYPHALAAGWLDRELYIMDPAAILGYLGVDVVYLGKKPMTRECDDREIEIVHWRYDLRGWHHFVAGSGTGDTTYDPWGVSITASKGDPVDKRIFRIERIREAA